MSSGEWVVNRNSADKGYGGQSPFGSNPMQTRPWMQRQQYGRQTCLEPKRAGR
jgi:hypothetical protein